MFGHATIYKIIRGLSELIVDHSKNRVAIFNSKIERGNRIVCREDRVIGVISVIRGGK
jgi:hypothetical protein